MEVHDVIGLVLTAVIVTGTLFWRLSNMERRLIDRVAKVEGRVAKVEGFLEGRFSAKEEH